MITIARAPAEVYAFAVEPSNLPTWASGLAGGIRQVDGAWIASSPMGDVRVVFAPRNQLGVLDHDVTLPTGVTVHNPVRVLPNATGADGRTCDQMAHESSALRDNHSLDWRESPTTTSRGRAGHTADAGRRKAGAIPSARLAAVRGEHGAS